MRIQATFIGKNMSLGYKTNKEYELKVCDNQAVCISRLDGTGRCYYSTLKTFLKNWENIKKLKGYSKNACPHDRVEEILDGGRFDRCLDCGKTWG